MSTPILLAVTDLRRASSDIEQVFGAIKKVEGSPDSDLHGCDNEAFVREIGLDPLVVAQVLGNSRKRIALRGFSK
jgi:hypothetical protein